MGTSQTVTLTLGFGFTAMYTALAYGISRDIRAAGRGDIVCDLSQEGFLLTTATLHDEDAWKVGHRAAGRWTFIGYIAPLALIAITALTVKFDWTVFAPLWAIVGGACVLVLSPKLLTVVAHRAASRHTNTHKEHTDG